MARTSDSSQTTLRIGGGGGGQIVYRAKKQTNDPYWKKQGKEREFNSVPLLCIRSMIYGLSEDLKETEYEDWIAIR